MPSVAIGVPFLVTAFHDLEVKFGMKGKTPFALQIDGVVYRLHTSRSAPQIVPSKPALHSPASDDGKWLIPN